VSGARAWIGDVALGLVAASMAAAALASMPPAAPPPGGSPPARPAPQRRIDLNRATAAELALLPGIGPGLAARIVAEREEGGAFRSVDDLARVSGIGPSTLDGVREHVAVGPGPTRRP
jgi:competence protein ComEA